MRHTKKIYFVIVPVRTEVATANIEGEEGGIAILRTVF